MLIALGTAGGFAVIAVPIQAFVLSRLKGTRVLWVNVASLLMDIIVAVCLIPFMGAWGAVIAMGSSGVLRLILFLSSEIRNSGPAGWREVGQCLLPAGIGAVAAAVGWGVSQQLRVPVVLTACLASLVAITVLTLGLRTTRSGLTTADARAVAQVLPVAARNGAMKMLRIVTWSR